MADFRTAILITLDPDHEGGYQNRPNDRGNWYQGVNYGTNHGITMADCVHYLNADPADHNFVRNLSTDQAVSIYRAGYWKDLYSQINDQTIANKLFDMGVLFGVGTAIKMLQISMQNSVHLVPDGIFGPETLADVNEKGNLAGYRVALLNHCMNVVNANPDDAEFLAGWNRRINS